jgi:hypothetical protein
MYFEENEKKWVDILKKVKSVVDFLKMDRGFLLNKQGDGMPEDLQEVLDN